ncbi:hypothetical protein TNCV_4629901 [Trichonephila clavipes]|nr:hypothetical protein TNCV_4629901 [Trichonephila clavipes]
MSKPEIVLNHDSYVALLHHVLKSFQSYRSYMWAYGLLEAPNPISGGEFDVERSFRFSCLVECFLIGRANLLIKVQEDVQLCERLLSHWCIASDDRYFHWLSERS